MAKLPFSFYKALFDELESYETHFLQLQRDYAREARGETLLFAVDFSELHNYMHTGDGTTINRYILETLNDQFSILPGAVGELFSDLAKILPRGFQPQRLLSDPAVAQFRSEFSNALHNEEYLIKLYANAETKLQGALGEISTILLSDGHTPIQRLKNLLDAGRLHPIEGVQHIGKLGPDDKNRLELVERYLNLSRPQYTENNQIYALDIVIALLLNEQGIPANNRYITIYSQASSLIQACRVHDKLRWDQDYLIREAKYLKFRTKLQEQFPTREQRQQFIEEGRKLIESLKTEISALINIDKKIQEGAIAPSLKLLDLFRKFDEEYRQPLSFRGKVEEKPVTPERAKQLYNTLIDDKKFGGKVQEAYEVLKASLREVQSEFQPFSPISTDPSEIKKYKKNLWKWLDLGIPEKYLSRQREEGEKNE